jgi:phage repressor protein C with HTH and peptisase S24 domain
LPDATLFSTESFVKYCSALLIGDGTMETLADWLNANLERSGMSPAELSRRSGVSESQISKMRNGDMLYSSRVNDIAHAFKRPASEVAAFLSDGTRRKIGQVVTDNVRRLNTPAQIEGHAKAAARLHQAADAIQGARSLSSLSGYREIDVVGRAAAGSDFVILGGLPSDKVFCPPELIAVEGVYAVQVVGESMRPMFRPGQRVVIHPRRALVPGEGVLVQKGDESSADWEGLIKEYVKRDEKGITLKEYQPKERTFVVPNDQIRSAHFVMVATTP